MKSKNEKYVCMIPVALLFVIIPLIVKVKFFANPLLEYPWYTYDETLADFFLYYKSVFVTITGILMLVLLGWQISKIRKKDTLINADMRIFIPILIYLVLVVFSSLFSKYGYFCTHGMPDQFETVWNLIAYIVATFYCYYLVVYHQSEHTILSLISVGVALVGLICVFQFLKLDLYRAIYAGEGYSFTFAEGVVYGPFYNTNYVGYYSLLFVPLFLGMAYIYKDIKVRIISIALVLTLLIAMIGAGSITAEIAFAAVAVFVVVFLLVKNLKHKKILWIPLALVFVACIGLCIVAFPRVNRYIKASNTEKTDLESIYTYDDHVEITYKGEKLLIQMMPGDSVLTFRVTDQDQNEIPIQYITADEGYYYYSILDERFGDVTLTPATMDDDSSKYGFMATLGDKNWCFTNQMSDDGTYYYYTDTGKLTKLTEENVSPDFAPLENMSSLANGRGYIWNKTITILKHHVLFGSGADTFTLAYPNDDFVDKYNNGYDNLIISKPHNLYLQMAVQTGVLSLLCFLVFYMWYFISGLRIYFRQRLDTPLSVTGFAIMLGTLGYMISGLANDSTITVAPLYWALMGIGIGINHRVKTAVGK